MVNPFICGSGSFHHHVEDDDDTGSPRKPRKGNKNPYSDRGLEKFSALLAELEDKKKQIYTQFGSDEISFIRFDYSNSNRCKPIVVKAKEKEKEKEKDHKQQQEEKDLAAIDPAAVEVQESGTESGDKKIDDQKKERRSSWKFLKRETWRNPSYYFPAVVILILVFLGLFGRSFAILCTSIGWYMVPTISGGELNVKRVKKKKKDYGRRASDKGMIVRERKKDYGRRASEKAMIVGASPTSVISGATSEFSPRKHGYRKSF